MNLHENPPLFNASIRAAAAHLGIPDTWIEKDYWLTTVLKKLGESPYRERFVFKGGTSLSKAFGLIQRFSEDVDLALLAEGLTGNQIKSRIDKVSKEITRHLSELKLDGVTKKWSRFRRTAHLYPVLELEPAPQSQISAFLVLELNAFGNPSPYAHIPIESMIANFFAAQNQNTLIAQYGLEPFSILVLHPERTLTEKVLALTRASYHANPIAQLQNKIRHTYDLHMLMTHQPLREFVNSGRFFEALQEAQKDDADSREFQGEWHQSPLAYTLIFSDTDILWKQLNQTYQSSFRPLVYGDLPDITAIRESLHMLKMRLQAFDSLTQS